MLVLYVSRNFIFSLFVTGISILILLINIVTNLSVINSMVIKELSDFLGVRKNTSIFFFSWAVIIKKW